MKARLNGMSRSRSFPPPWQSSSARRCWIARSNGTGVSVPVARDDWILADGMVHGGGDPVDGRTIQNTCTCTPSFAQCVQDHGWVQQIPYHPEPHFWTLQYAESGFFIAL